MKWKVSNKILFWLVVFIIFTIICAYFFNWYTNICIWVNWVCTNIPIWNLGTIFLSIMWVIFPIILWIWRHYILKEKDDEKNNHFKFLRTIQEKEWKFDLLYFDEFGEAEKRFNSYKKGFILPIWYEYNIWQINIFKSDLIDKIEKWNYSNIKEFSVELIDSLDIWDNKIWDYKSFIDLEEYIKKLKSNWLREFDLTNNIIINSFNNNFFELIDWNINKNKLLKYLKEDIDYLVLIKGYYILYYKD